jgi:DNA-binding XRE family transcriptional regulator
MTLRQQRDALSWSQERMARKLDLSLSTYCRHEAAEARGTAAPVWLQLAVAQLAHLAAVS